MSIHKTGFLLLFGALLSALAVAGPTSRGQAPPPAAARLPLEVRVFDGGKFVGDLGLKDFELLEGGIPQTPEAVFLIRRGQIERREGTTDIRPDLSRKLSILFQLNEYSGKMDEAITHLFTKGLVPGDSLEIQTPVRNYQLSGASLAAKPPAVLAKELIRIVRRDIVQGSVVYNNLLRELKTIVRLIGSAGGERGEEATDTEGEVDSNSPLELQLMRYKEDLQKMEDLRAMTDSSLAAYAEKLRRLPGQKFVFYFYQREFRPEISSNTMDALMMNNQDRPDILAELQTIFPLYHRFLTLDSAKLGQVFADSAANFNFLFLNKTAQRLSNITMREQSEDVFRALSTIAEASGGIVESSQNPDASIETAMRTAESYYLLFFSPAVAAPPGRFIDLNVRVKGRDYKIVHPAGYLTRS